MALPFERMTLQPGDALGCIGVQSIWTAALQQSLAVGLIAQQRQVMDMGGLVEIQRRSGVQLVVQGGALRVHGRSGLVL